MLMCKFVYIKDTLIPANKNRKRRAGARPQAGRFRRVSRGGTSSVVDTKKIPPFGWHRKEERV